MNNSIKTRNSNTLFNFHPKTLTSTIQLNFQMIVISKPHKAILREYKYDTHNNLIWKKYPDGDIWEYKYVYSARGQLLEIVGHIEIPEFDTGHQSANI